MRHYVPVCLLILLFGVAAAAAEPWTDGEIRLLSYNIYHGGQDFGQVTGRQHEWLEVICSRNPDIILIQEANGWLPSDSNYVAAYEESLNAFFPDEPPYAGHVGDANSLFDLALFTRLPLVSTEMVTSAWLDGGWFYPSKGFLHAVLADSAGAVHVINGHFKSGTDREFREKEARVLLQILDGIPSGESVWIGGDFNSYSPVDVAPGSPTPPAYELGADSAEVIGWEPVAYLLDCGCEDGFRDLHPLELGYTKHTREFYPYPTDSLMRVDFLLHSPHVGWDLETAEVITDGLADVGSDHYAVFAVYGRSSGTTDVVHADADVSRVSLRSRPNPFSTNTSIEFSAAGGEVVRLDVFSVMGRRVKSLVCPTGAGEVVWDGRDDQGGELPAGWYFIRMARRGHSESTRVLLLR